MPAYKIHERRASEESAFVLHTDQFALLLVAGLVAGRFAFALPSDELRDDKRSDQSMNGGVKIDA